jgi:tRNA-dihydrouridine synthase C
MEGITDAPMRTLQGATGAFTFAVSEFLRVNAHPIPEKVFLRDVPELENGARTPTGLPVQIQLLGGDPGRMAESAAAACAAGAIGVDINFGCPAKTVNRHDGGATLLQHPDRIREIVAAIREAVPQEIPVSAKLRLGWDSIESIHLNAERAAEGGASWITIHGRTRTQGYLPPIFWRPIGEVRRTLDIPVVANGDIWTREDFLRCREETGSIHFMIGRGALANPGLPAQISRELGMAPIAAPETDWGKLFRSLVDFMEGWGEKGQGPSLMRLKQWMKLAHLRGTFAHFDALKQTRSLPEFFETLDRAVPTEIAA